MSDRTRPRSRHTYTWNHFGPLLTAATSSIERVDMVDNVYGRPAAAAARATASSPCGSAMRLKPVGASSRGTGRWRPSNVVDVSTIDTSRSTRGWNVMLPKCSTLAASARSSSAPPSM
jgi:hypothetical protein